MATGTKIATFGPHEIYTSIWTSLMFKPFVDIFALNSTIFPSYLCTYHIGAMYASQIDLSSNKSHHLIFIRMCY
jgi:hypothetical protein